MFMALTPTGPVLQRASRETVDLPCQPATHARAVQTNESSETARSSSANAYSPEQLAVRRSLPSRRYGLFTDDAGDDAKAGEISYQRHGMVYMSRSRFSAANGTLNR